LPQKGAFHFPIIPAMATSLQIDAPPHDGINIWMLSTARKCQLAELPAWEAEKRIMEFNGSARRSFKTNEVKRAVEKAYGTTLAPSNFTPNQDKPRWQPERTRQTSYRSIPKGIAAVDLWEASPDRIDEGITQRMILDWLFPDPDRLVCVGKSAFEFHAARLNQFKDLTACQFIVPCYMTAKYGTTQDGKQSMHCLDNCGPRRFCVCDFDEPKSADHPAIIWQLRKTFDLVMVVSSGGKSLHAWFWVEPDEEEHFWKAAIPLGADPALMRNRSSFVRIPEGKRDTGARQNVLYFDHSKIRP
jgi:hypothetical protein